MTCRGAAVAGHMHSLHSQKSQVCWLGVQVVRDAIRKGWITWHAFPYNGQMEMFDSSLLEFALQLVHDLDAEFDLPPKHTLSQVSWVQSALSSSICPTLLSVDAHGCTRGWCYGIRYG